VSPADLLLARAAAVLDLAIAQAPEAAAHLQRLEGRRIRIKPAPLPLEVLVRVQGGALHLGGADPAPAEVEIEGSPLALLAMLRPNAGTGAAAGVRIAGDLGAAQALQAFLRALEVDWEELASHYVGDVAAHRLGRAGRGLRQWLGQARQALEADTAEYLRNELDLLPDSTEVAAFVAEVDRARDDLERLEARLRRLESQPRPRGGGR